jgi:hypothetical protein
MFLVAAAIVKITSRKGLEMFTGADWLSIGVVISIAVTLLTYGLDEPIRRRIVEIRRSKENSQ